MLVYVLSYEHRHGTTLRVFTKPELADAATREYVRRFIDEHPDWDLEGLREDLADSELSGQDLRQAFGDFMNWEESISVDCVPLEEP